jgi:hypothetical protein
MRQTEIDLCKNYIVLVSKETTRGSMLTCRVGSPHSGAPLPGQYGLHLPNTLRRFLSWLKHQMPVLDAKDLLPLGIQVFKGVITCGNASTPSLLVAEFSVCQGTFSITRVSSSCLSSCRYSMKRQTGQVKT